jgi:hypothetical protein
MSHQFGEKGIKAMRKSPNRTIPRIYNIFPSKILYSLPLTKRRKPQQGWSIWRESNNYHNRFVLNPPRRNATDNHRSLESKSNSLMIFGYTTATIVLSKANRIVEDRMAKSIRAQIVPSTNPGAGSTTLILPFSWSCTNDVDDVCSAFPRSMVEL